MITDSLMIVFISLCTALLSEGKSAKWCLLLKIQTPPGLSYVLLYRTDGYKRLKDVVEKQSRKCEIIVLLIPHALRLCFFLCM